MLQVKAVSREYIDSWPIPESGLSARVVHSVMAAGISTVGELRGWPDRQLLALKSLGRISLNGIKAFYRLCGQIEQGKQSFQNIREVFDIFWDEDEFRVVAARYGFHRRDLAAASDWATLQEIANAENKTRERIRQIEDVALQHLNSRLAKLCLQPFVDYFVKYIDALGKAANCADLAPLQDDPLLAGFNVGAVALLLANLHPDRMNYHNKVFCTAPVEVIRKIEEAGWQMLSEKKVPLSLDALAEAMPPFQDLAAPEQRRRVISMILEHKPGVGATTDNRFFCYPEGAAVFMGEVLRGLQRPAHYRMIANAFNDRLKPLSRKGAGYVLELLNSNPLCTRTDRGWYDLKAE
jgi:hypothetical protein